LTAAQTGLPSFGPSDFTIDFGQPILNFQDDDGSGVCIEVVASGGFGGGSGSDGGFPSNPDCQVDGDVVVDNAGGNITLSFIDSGSLVPGNSIGISGVVLSEENSETVHAVVLSTAMPILAGQNVALVVSCGPVGNSGLQQQVDDLEQDFADHTHPYLTGKGQGHNNVEATTGPADVPSPE
jgi:hypothetical protein